MGFRFAVIADSHFHPVVGAAQQTYPSDAQHNGRNQAVVAALKDQDLAFVVHLGDVPHPVPSSDSHAEALQIASDLYAQLPCPVMVVPGNHDVGDKPHPWTPAPPTHEAFHEVFERTWGPDHQVWEHQGCRFVVINTPILGTGSHRETQQATWLDGLGPYEGQTFVFIHYPPFLLHPNEDAHYDNIDPEARQGFLTQLESIGPTAIFCGHVHNFFWHDHQGTDIWIAPATSFVRPEYSELSPIPPSRENGRNEVNKLGLFLVHVDGPKHQIEPVRMLDLERDPATAIRGFVPHCPLGVTWRHAWDAVCEVPIGNLDEFSRKSARNDLSFLAALDLGIHHIRVPLTDLRDRGERMRGMSRHGLRWHVFSLGAPTPGQRALIKAYDDVIVGWEIIVPAETVADTLPGYRSIVGSPAHSDVHSHFQPHGYNIAEAKHVNRPVIRVGMGHDIGLAAEVAQDQSGMLLVELPRGSEAAPYQDEHGLTQWVLAAKAVAHKVPTYLDGFVDHDRGYFPRWGLMTRDFAPHEAYEALRR